MCPSLKRCRGFLRPWGSITGTAGPARELVVWAATRAHLDVEARPVVEVTRTAADVARSLVAGQRIGERAMRHLSMWLGLFRFRPDDDGLWLPA